MIVQRKQRMRKKYNLPTEIGVKECIFFADGDYKVDYPRIKAIVRKMNLREVEEIISELIYGQVTEKILLVSKVSKEETQ